MVPGGSGGGMHPGEGHGDGGGGSGDPFSTFLLFMAWALTKLALIAIPLYTVMKVRSACIVWGLCACACVWGGGAWLFVR
jgi:hypothetical protein